MRFWLLGRNGQVGRELLPRLQALGTVEAPGRNDPGGDLSKPAEVARAIAAAAPDVVVNAAAYTAVDRAESEPELADLVNAQAPAAMARACEAAGAWLVHYSTDYVFNGSGQRPWREGDAPAPLSVYGRTKLAGEQGVAAATSRHLIFRTSWVHGAQGGNFIRTMLRLAAEREQLNVVADQIGAPTSASLIAQVTVDALNAARDRPELAGLYHLAAAGETSWQAYARFVIGQARARGVALRVPPEAVFPLATADYPTPARRPLNSRLDTQRLQAAFGLRLPHWEEGVLQTLEGILHP